MRGLLLAFCLSASSSHALGNGVTQLKAIESRYDQTAFKGNEPLRQRYMMDLATLRQKLAFGKADESPTIAQIDQEMMAHPSPINSESKILSDLRIGIWHSPRHDYLFKADRTWQMDPEDNDPGITHGTWAIDGNRYTETVAVSGASQASTYTIILLDPKTCIIASGTDVFIEKRRLGKGLQLRRDGT